MVTVKNPFISPLTATHPIAEDVVCILFASSRHNVPPPAGVLGEIFFFANLCPLLTRSALLTPPFPLLLKEHIDEYCQAKCLLPLSTHSAWFTQLRLDRSVSSIYDFKNVCIFSVLTSGVAPGQEPGGACEHAAHPLFQMPPQLL